MGGRGWGRQGKGICISTMQKRAILRKCVNIIFVPHCSPLTLCYIEVPLLMFWQYYRYRYVCVIDQTWGQDGCILARFFYVFIKDQDKVKILHERKTKMEERKKINKANIKPPFWLNKLGQLPVMIYYVAITKSDLVGQSVKRAR